MQVRILDPGVMALACYQCMLERLLEGGRVGRKDMGSSNSRRAVMWEAAKCVSSLYKDHAELNKLVCEMDVKADGKAVIRGMCICMGSRLGMISGFQESQGCNNWWWGCINDEKAAACSNSNEEHSERLGRELVVEKVMDSFYFNAVMHVLRDLVERGGA